MSRKFKTWLDIGTYSGCARKETVTLDELGIADEEWDAMSEDEQNEVMRPVICVDIDWGYEEIGEDDDGDEDDDF